MSSEGSLLGRTLAGRFRINAFIGEGGMANVYRAEQPGEPRDVAVKILHPSLVGDPTFVRRFRREAKAAARVAHPNSVRILDTGVDGDLLYIAMELLVGQDLFERLVIERRLPESRAVELMIEVTDALAAAHAQGVIHRDLKPENIMLVGAPDGTSRELVKVLDFGIAKILERDMTASSDALPAPSAALTGVDTVVGTPAYMSPEQCRGDPVGPTSDIYGCGVLLFQILSGRLPFTAASNMELAVMHVRAAAPPLASVVPSVNPELADLVRRCLAKWPAERPQTASELAAELRAILPRTSRERLVVGAIEPPPVVIHTDSGDGLVVDDRAPTLAADRSDEAAPPLAGPVARAHEPLARADDRETLRGPEAGRGAPRAIARVAVALIAVLCVIVGVAVAFGSR